MKTAQNTYKQKLGLNSKNSDDDLKNTNDKELDNGITFWEKPESTTKAGSRKRHIIVFNKNKVKNYSLEFEFDQTLKNKFI